MRAPLVPSTLLLLALWLPTPTCFASERRYCDEVPLEAPALSEGRASRGRLWGAAKLEDSPFARVMPRKHRARCLAFATPRLVAALERAARSVKAHFPDTPPLGVGDLSRARGGPIPPWSRSHQSGRDADLAFYQRDAAGRPVPAEDLTVFDKTGFSREAGTHFDDARTWALVKALLTDPSIDVQWMFISVPLKERLLAHARRLGEPLPLLRRADAALHQPTDSLPHGDHIHLRIRCTDDERARGCEG